MNYQQLINQRAECSGHKYWLAYECNVMEVDLACFYRKDGVDSVSFHGRATGEIYDISDKDVGDCVFDNETDAIIAARDECRFRQSNYQERLDLDLKHALRGYNFIGGSCSCQQSFAYMKKSATGADASGDTNEDPGDCYWADENE